MLNKIRKFAYPIIAAALIGAIAACSQAQPAPAPAAPQRPRLPPRLLRLSSPPLPPMPLRLSRQPQPPRLPPLSKQRPLPRPLWPRPLRRYYKPCLHRQ